MASVTTNDLRITNAKNFVKYLTDGDPSYMFIGRPQRWDTTDNSPPYPDNNWEDYYRVWDQMLAMNKINSLEVLHMIPRLNWSSGATYDMYRHDYNETNKSHSNAKNLYDSVFFVVAQNNNVYICLNNNNDRPSTVEPLAESDEPFYTSDGYQWLRSYSLSSFILNSKGTNNFMPIVDNRTNKLGDGEIYSVVIDARGDDYTSFPRGVNNEIPYYYCNITGDGQGAVARVGVASGKIFEVTVVRPGSKYNYATMDFTTNRVYESLSDLDQGKNGLDPRGDGSFASTVIISPVGGWGTDVVRELGGTRIGVFSDFRLQNSDYIVESEFRQIGIMSEIDIVNGTTPESLSMVQAVKVNEVTGSMNQDYQMYETITQTKTHPDDPTIKYIGKGMVVGWDDATGIIRYIQDPTIHTHNGQLYGFTGTDAIIGELTKKESIPDLGANGDIDDKYFTGGYAIPEANKYKGQLNYVTNLSPIKRSPEQSERVSLIISY